MLRRLLVFLAFVSIALVPASPAAAHNTLLSSDPADGAALTELPTQMTLVFDKSVPLDTLSIELIDATVAQESASSIATMSALPGSTVSITTTTLAQPVTAVLANQRSPGSSASAVCLIAGTLVSGSTGDDVTCLQQALIVQSLLEGSPSGAFDAATDQAVRTFQFERSLLADGIVGPVTAAALGIWATS